MTKIQHIMLIKFISSVILCAVLFGGSGCTYFMFWKVATYEHDDTTADRNIEELERERVTRMQKNGNYRDSEINAINRDAVRRSSDTRSLSIEELRAQQEREREARGK